MKKITLYVIIHHVEHFYHRVWNWYTTCNLVTSNNSNTESHEKYVHFFGGKLEFLTPPEKIWHPHCGQKYQLMPVKFHRKAVKQGQALWWAIGYQIPTGQESLISLQFVDWPRVYQSDNFIVTAAKMSAYKKRKAYADEKFWVYVSI